MAKDTKKQRDLGPKEVGGAGCSKSGDWSRWGTHLLHLALAQCHHIPTLTTPLLLLPVCAGRIFFKLIFCPCILIWKSFWCVL